MHQQAFAFVAAHRVDGARFVLEIGSRNINGSVRPLFADAREYHGIDIAPGAGVDAVGDGATYVPHERPDVVVCCEVLEHTRRAEGIVGNAMRLLRPKGLFLMTCAGDGRAPHSAVDGGALREGEFYRNVSEAVFRQWIKRHGGAILALESDPHAGDLRVVVQKGKEPK